MNERLRKGFGLRRPWLALSAVALLALGAVACSDAAAQQPASGDQRGIAVEGEATVTVPPDIAELHIGVETRASSVEEARNEAAVAMEAVREAILAQGVDESDLQTSSLQVWPEHRNGPPEPADSGDSNISGYVVSNMLEVTVRDIDATSTIVDEAIAAGGDAARVQGIMFTVDDPEAHLHDARRQAVELARERAEALADAAGVSVGEVIAITEGSSPQWPIPGRGGDFAEDSAAVDTPIEPGEQELRLTVSVVYAIE